GCAGADRSGAGVRAAERDVPLGGMAARRRGLHPRGDRGADGQDGELFQIAVGAGACAAAADAGCGGSSTMMHCTIDDLLALKENEESAWAKQHLEACPACRAELDALYQRIAALKALPVRRSEEHTSELQSREN